MEVWEAILAQRAVRRFADRPIPEDSLAQILEAARRAPSSKNEQRWAFVVVQGRDRLRELSTVGDYAQHLAGAAAGIALVTPDSEIDWERESIAYDLGQATQNLMLRAWELGIGTVHAAVYEADRTRQILGYPPAMRCDVIISAGYPAAELDMSAPRTKLDRASPPTLRHDETW